MYGASVISPLSECPIICIFCIRTGCNC